MIALAVFKMVSSYINVDLGMYMVFPQQIFYLITDAGIVFLLFKGKPAKKLMLVILMDGIMYTSTFIFLPCVHYLVQQEISILSPARLYELCDTFSIVSGAVIYEWVIRKYRNFQGEITAEGILYLFGMALFVKISVIYFAQSQIDTESLTFWHMVASTLLAVTGIFIIVFSIYYIDRRLVLSLMEQQNYIMEKHLDAAVEAERQMAGFRHDFKNHMLCMEKLLQTGHSDEAREYLHAITKSVNSYSGNFSSGNIYADAVLREKCGIAAANGIAMEVNMILPGEGEISPLDLCIILGNSLDNALEACSSLEKGAHKPVIRVLSYVRRNCLMIELHNTISPHKTPGTGKFAFLPTTKQDKRCHGIGLTNIQAAVERYGGTLDLSVSGEEFHFCVMLPLTYRTEKAGEIPFTS